MKYRNTRTGAVIETSGKISGGDWQAVPAATEVLYDDAGVISVEENIEKEETVTEADSTNDEVTPKTKEKTATKPVKKSESKTGVKRTTKK